MRNLRMATMAALLLVSHGVCAEENKEFSKLYDCTQKLHHANAHYDINYDLEFLENDLFYILDRHTPELYLYTPYFAGKADLSGIIQMTVKAALDKDAQKVRDQSFPFTPCCQGGMAYNVRVPYFPRGPSEQSGYYYMTITDASPGMYDEVYWVRAEHKMHIKRHEEPFLKNPHDARINGINRFLAGPSQALPDFTNYKPKQAENGITITSVTGQLDKDVEYRPFDVEQKLWDKKAQDNFSEEAKDRLVSTIRNGLAKLPQAHKVGQRSDCWGHAGCDYTFSEEEVAQEQAIRMAAINSCKAAADEFGLNIFSPYML